MTTFDHHCDYIWFEFYVRTRYRYRYDEQVNHFIGAVVESSKSRIVKWKTGTPLWRAQRGCSVVSRDEQDTKRRWKDDDDGYPRFEQDCSPFSVERMKPQPDKAKEGRINAKGIPFLYLATHEDTAMSEVRPWHEAKISLARFELTHDVALVDCSRRWKSSQKEDEPINREAFNWNLIGEAFSRPVSASDDVADYAPTQIVAEALRQQGYDGIIYNSGLNKDGKNVVLFDLDHADVKERSLYTLSDVSYFFWKIVSGDDHA
jgi:RES domain-containing protein